MCGYLEKSFRIYQHKPTDLTVGRLFVRYIKYTPRNNKNLINKHSLHSTGYAER